MDVKSAFLNGDLLEKVYVHQPPGFVNSKDAGKTLKLNKALYGLRQAPRAWYACLDQELMQLGFRHCILEHAVYRRGDIESFLLVGVYVDDLIICGPNVGEINKFKQQMMKSFKMSDLGLLSYYLGIEVKQKKEEITLSQRAYTAKILEVARMTGCNTCCTPMETRAGRPLNLVGFSDSDHAGDKNDRKSTMGIVFFLGGNLITWASQKQKVVALSSCEAEYIAASAAACQGVWLSRLMAELVGNGTAEKFKLFVDNQSAIELSKNPAHHDRIKHIDTRFHYRQVQQPAPARVIAADGSPKELPASSSSSRVSDVVGHSRDTASSTSFFVCNSDALYFNEHPPVLSPGELLRPGQIYFVPPADMLERPLSTADMAALAVRASTALASSSTPRSRRARGGDKKKAVVRVVPVRKEMEDDGGEDVGLFNEKLNQLTLGQFGVASSVSPAKRAEKEKLAAASRLKRALSLVQEDAE
ncbi:hypothetical protein U9M48_005538 [Paspalum notatum var. saurae]|uniref:Reverse transcriptase Ty1/copia-type domain-containing protein n=1 Tax=Paspalum notatum var. saurae TaxID=547442 RepID=A0AAQ3PMM4_PASNO